VRSRKDNGAQMARRNPYGYIIAGRTRPHAYSATRDFPYKDRSEAKRVIGERVRAMGRRGDDVAFDAFLTEPRGRKIGKTRIRVPGYARNPEVWLDWQQRGHTMRDPTGRPLHTGRALWRKGLSKRGAKREAAAARKYARRQKDWTKYGVTVKRNPHFSMIEHFLGVKPEDIPPEGLPWREVVRRQRKQRKSWSRGRIVRGKRRVPKKHKVSRRPIRRRVPRKRKAARRPIRRRVPRKRKTTRAYGFHLLPWQRAAIARLPKVRRDGVLEYEDPDDFNELMDMFLP
jgi:hypothetical protein